MDGSLMLRILCMSSIVVMIRWIPSLLHNDWPAEVLMLGVWAGRSPQYAKPLRSTRSLYSTYWTGWYLHCAYRHLKLCLSVLAPYSHDASDLGHLHRSLKITSTTFLSFPILSYTMSSSSVIISSSSATLSIFFLNFCPSILALGLYDANNLQYFHGVLR